LYFRFSKNKFARGGGVKERRRRERRAKGRSRDRCNCLKQIR